MGFEIFTGTQSITSKGSLNSIFHFKAVKVSTSESGSQVVSKTLQKKFFNSKTSLSCLLFMHLKCDESRILKRRILEDPSANSNTKGGPRAIYKKVSFLG